MATAIPTHATGDVLPAADWNDLTVLNTQVGLFGATTPYVGSGAPGATAPSFLLECGSSVVTTSAGAVATINFPVAFPNGIMTALVCSGDPTSNACSQVEAMTTSTKSTLLAACQNNLGANINSLAVRVNWICIGF